MAKADSSFEEQPTPCVLDEHDRERLLDRLIAVHGRPRSDVASELTAATVSRARGVTHVTAQTITGRDGKARRAVA
jgi:hypothetical protein